MTPKRQTTTALFCLSCAALLMLGGASHGQREFRQRVPQKVKAAESPAPTISASTEQAAPAEGRLMAQNGEGTKRVLVKDNKLYVEAVKNNKTVGESRQIKGISAKDVNDITALALNKDGSRLAVGYRQSGIQIWDEVSEKKWRNTGSWPEESAVIALAFVGAPPKTASDETPAEDLVSCDANGSLMRWITDTHKQVALQQNTGGLKNLVFDPNRNTLYGLDKTGENVIPYDVKNPTVLKPGKPIPVGEAFAKGNGTAPPEGGAAGGLVQGVISLFKKAAGLLNDNTEAQPAAVGAANAGANEYVVLKPSQKLTGSFSGLAFSPKESGLLASAGTDKNVRLWDVKPQTAPPGKKQAMEANGADALWSYTDDASSVAFSPDGKYIASGGWGKDLRFKSVEETLPGTLSSLSSVTLSSSAAPRGHTDAVLCLAFRPSSAGAKDEDPILASGGMDKKIILWHLRQGKDGNYHYDTLSAPPAQAPTAGIACLAFSPDGSILAAGSLNGSVYLWKFSAAKAEAKFFGVIATGQESARCLACLTTEAGNPLIFATAGIGKDVKLWDLGDAKNWHTPKPEEVRTLQGVGVSNVYSLAYKITSKGPLLAAGTGETQLFLWQIDTQDPMNTPAQPARSIQPEDHKAPNTHPASGAKVTAKKGIVRSLAFDQSGKWMASGGGGGNSSILLWNLDTLSIP